MDILVMLEKIQAIAKTGLEYAGNAYDQRRYSELLELSIQYYAEALETPAPKVREKLLSDLGIVTPKVGTDAAIFDDQGRILLMLRSDNQKWGMTGGMMEVGETIEQCAIREAKEETGLDVRVLELVGVFTRFPTKEYTPFTLVTVVYLCEVMGGQLQGSSEDLGLKYWEVDQVPTWHGPHEAQVRKAKALWQKLRST